MSRSGSIQQALGDTEIRVRAIKPNGDCFYEAISAAFTMMTEDVRQCKNIVVEEGDSQAMALRRTAAASVDEEVFNQFSMCHLAGLSDFHFMTLTIIFLTLTNNVTVLYCGSLISIFNF